MALGPQKLAALFVTALLCGSAALAQITGGHAPEGGYYQPPAFGYGGGWGGGWGGGFVDGWGAGSTPMGSYMTGLGNAIRARSIQPRHLRRCDQRRRSPQTRHRKRRPLDERLLRNAAHQPGQHPSQEIAHATGNLGPTGSTGNTQSLALQPARPGNRQDRMAARAARRGVQGRSRGTGAIVCPSPRPPAARSASAASTIFAKRPTTLWPGCADKSARSTPAITWKPATS